MLNLKWSSVILVIGGTACYLQLAFLHTMPSPQPTPRCISSSSLLQYEVGFTNQSDPSLVEFIAKRWLLAPSQEPRNLIERNLTDFSQVGQTAFVDELLGRRTGGFYVECGAASGEALSNTLFFELKRGWSGMLIEADPKQFDSIVRKKRRAYLANVCLSTTNSTGRLTYYLNDVFGGLNKGRGRGQPIMVQCFPFYPLLRAAGTVRVDYFSLDVEGAELDILRTIPFSAVYIDVIGVEYRVNEDRGVEYRVNGDKQRRFSPNGTLAKLKELRDFFRGLGTYKEVGILPWGTYFNPKKTEVMGLDVFFKHV